MGLWITKVKEKVNSLKKLIEFTILFLFYKVKMLCNIWKTFKQNFVFSLFMKHLITLLLFVRKSISKLLNETELCGTQNDTYILVNTLKEEIIDNNILPAKFDLEVQNDFKMQPIMCWLSKMHKTLTEETPRRKWSTKASSKAVTKAFRLILKQIQSFHENSDYKTFWMAQNLGTVTDRLDQIKTKHNANLIYTFDFTIFYNKLPHKDLITFWLDLSFNRGFSLY